MGNPPKKRMFFSPVYSWKNFRSPMQSEIHWRGALKRPRACWARLKASWRYQADDGFMACSGDINGISMGYQISDIWYIISEDIWCVFFVGGLQTPTSSSFYGQKHSIAPMIQCLPRSLPVRHVKNSIRILTIGLWTIGLLGYQPLLFKY